MTAKEALLYLNSLYKKGIPIKTIWVDLYSEFESIYNLTRLSYEEMFQVAHAVIRQNPDSRIVIAQWDY